MVTMFAMPAVSAIIIIVVTVIVIATAISKLGYKTVPSDARAICVTTGNKP